MSYLEQKAWDKLRKFAQQSYNKVVVKPGELHFNFRCHRNAVHYAVRNKHNRIAMVLYDWGDSISVHFINVYQDKKTKEDYFVDNTIGEWSNQCDYYFVRWVMEEDFPIIDRVFSSYRMELNKMLPFWMTIFRDKQAYF